MQVVFGWDLDGPCFPETAAEGAPTINSALVGPRGLLGLLETRLGLRRPNEQRAVRIAQYLALLHKVDDKTHFFSDSLRVDPWATADRLLQARDELVAAGWNGKAIAEFPKLVSLAAVEDAGKISLGFGERLEEVIAGVEATDKSPIGEMRLVGGIELLPKALQRLLGVLQKKGMQLHNPGEGSAGAITAGRDSQSLLSPVVPALAPTTSDLSIVRTLLTSRESTTLAVRGDGSFVVIDADDELQAAEMVAAWLRTHEHRRDVVIIRGDDSSALNQACQRFALPQVGSTVRSEFRSVLQVLPFAFEMAWRPIDPKRLAEFLTLDGGPIPYMVAHHLLDALAEHPGIGGELWRDKWKTIYKNEVEQALSSDASKARNDAEKEAKEKVAKWHEWFEPSVQSLNAQISIDEAIKVCKRVATWATMRAQFNPPHRLYEIAVQHSRLLAQLLRECGSTAISSTQLRKMVGAVTGYGVTSSSAEAADWTVIDRPGQIWNRADTVIWWQFAQPSAQSVKLSVWSSNEIEELAKHNIYIDSPLQRLRRESFAWRAPLVQAAQKLIIVKPRMVAGQDAIPHPLWDEICSRIDERQLRKATVHAAQVYSKPALECAGLTLTSEPRTFVKLPSVHRNWELPASVVKPRENNESFSSINKLLGCSFAWVLEYQGWMRQPKPLDLPQKDLLLGKLAHAVFDAVYKEKKKWRPDEARAKAVEVLDAYIPERAAVLLLPGSGPQLRQAREAIPDAVEHLTRVLNDANLRVDATEVPLSAKFGSKERGLAGNADMLAYTAENVPVLLDFKWSASPGWHRKKIAKGEALQLAIYAYLALHLKGATGEIKAEDWPPVGYFMLRGKEMYFTKDGVFPSNSHVRKQARSMKETWDVMLVEYERELAEILSGNVTAYGVDPDSQRFVDSMRQLVVEAPCKFCNLGYICGKEELQ
jgi:ATP-dependent helicase/nuclease subunit B